MQTLAQFVWLINNQFCDLTPTIGEDLAERIASEHQVPLQHLPPFKWVSIPVRFFTQNPVYPMISDPLLATIGLLPVNN